MITQDLGVAAEEGYIRYMASNYAHSPSMYNLESIYDILDVMSGDIFSYGYPTFAYQGSSKPFVVKFKDMQVGDNIRFVFYDNFSPIQAGSKLPVLSMTINGEEVLLPSKIPQIEGNVYSAYADYQVTQNINNIEISLFVRDDISSNGNDILEGEDVTNVTLQEPPNVCTQGLRCIDVKRTETINNQGGEVIMEREIMLGLGRIKVKKAGDTEYTEIGDTKSEAKLAIEEKYADVKTVESGTIKKVLESTTVTLEATISQLSKELLAKLTNMTNTAGVLSGGGGIGTVAPEFELIFHPLDESGMDWDVRFFKCTLETKLEKNAKAGEQAGLNIKAEALYDREAGKKFQIGTPSSLT